MKCYKNRDDRLGVPCIVTEEELKELFRINGWGEFNPDDYDLSEIVGCECGQITGEACDWEGPEDERVLVEFMPKELRESHIKAGCCGEYPHNGSVRVYCSENCAKSLCENDSKWISMCRHND